jgi:hypothetical protein
MNFRHLSDTSCVLLLQRHFFTFPTETKDLPISEFEKSQGKVAGKDAQSFHMPNDLNPIFPGYKVGCLILPPKGIKDAVSVEVSAHVFTIVHCQPGALEAAFVVPEGNSWNSETAQRSLLSVGDQFLIPPGNCYRLENHSESTKAILSYTVILHNRYVAGLDHHDAKMPHVARTASSDHDDTR